MNKTQFDKKKFDVDAHGNLYPKTKGNGITMGEYQKQKKQTHTQSVVNK